MLNKILLKNIWTIKFNQILKYKLRMKTKYIPVIINKKVFKY